MDPFDHTGFPGIFKQTPLRSLPQPTYSMSIDIVPEKPTQSVAQEPSNPPKVLPADPSQTLPWPKTAVEPVQVRWRYAISIPLIHLLACLAFVPWFFSWTGVALSILGLYVFGTLGINIGYHRLLTHRGMNAPKWFEHTLALLGVCTMQDTPACWVAMHRIHHQHSDHQPDPHSPLVTFLWGHFGWLMFENRDFTNVKDYQRFTRDLLKDPFYLKLERHWNWLKVYLAVAALYPIVGFVLGWLMSGNLWGGIQFGSSLLVWGVFVRTVLNWHITWSVNSVTHIWGYRNYETKDNSRNNWLIGLIANGEGWHNNHHADQRAASHGHRWWEFDVSWLTIRLFEKLGLVYDVVRPQSWKR